VDRSAGHIWGRHIAKNLVGLRRCPALRSGSSPYAIGVANPVSVNVETYGTGLVPEAKLEQIVRDVFPAQGPLRSLTTCICGRPILRIDRCFWPFSARHEPSFTWGIG